MTDDERPPDWALFQHERQTRSIDNDDDDHGDIAIVVAAATTATAAAKRERKTALRSSQGDRTDWKGLLVNAPGYRNIPDKRLTLRTKQARSQSIKAALERREKRRALGIAIHYDQFAWKRLGQAKRDQFDLGRQALAWIGPRWDAERDFSWYGNERDGGQHLDHLFRFGTAKALPKMSWSQHQREGL